MKRPERNHGLVSFDRLHQLWDNPKRNEDIRYSSELHPIFLRLMERFDLSYRVAGLSSKADTNPVSLIAQLVPDIRPTNLDMAWPSTPPTGDIQQLQICRIVDDKGQSATAEGFVLSIDCTLAQIFSWALALQQQRPLAARASC